MTVWQWHQLDHMQIICTSRQHLITHILNGQMLFLQKSKLTRYVQNAEL